MVQSSRRLGKESSEARARLIEAALDLMAAEGYPAVTSRGLAKFAGIKPQLIHYYFRTMDDLYTAMFQRLGDGYLRELQALQASDDALLHIWNLSSRGKRSILMVEFLALANRKQSIQVLMEHYADEYRKIQAGIVEQALLRRGLDPGRWNPDGIAVILENLPRILGIGDEFGIRPGYAEARELVSSLLEDLVHPKNEAKARSPQ